MKKLLLTLLLIGWSLSAQAFPLQTIDLKAWNDVYSNVAPKILVQSDSYSVTNPDGTTSILTTTFWIRYRAGTENICIRTNVANFLLLTATKMNLWNALMTAYVGPPPNGRWRWTTDGLVPQPADVDPWCLP